MDIVLERVLSLIPQKPDGNYVHGAKKDFCQKIGAPENIVSEWVKGKNKSYRNYLYAISSIFQIPVEWLRGETDQKEKPLSIVLDEEEPSDPLEVQLIGYMKNMTLDQKELLLAQMKTLKELQAPNASDRQ